MFVIKANEEKHFYHNSIKDDFLRYMPLHFGVEQKDLDVWFLPDSLKRRRVEIWMNGEGRAVDISEEGYLWLTETEPTIDRIEKVELTKLKVWPYDSVGNFTGKF